MQQAARVSDKTAFFLNGYVNEYDDTDKIFSNPSDKQTEIIFQDVSDNIWQSLDINTKVS